MDMIFVSRKRADRFNPFLGSLYASFSLTLILIIIIMMIITMMNVIGVDDEQ